jgi:S1-C subfamily serine protease
VPPNIREVNPKVRAITEDATILCRKFGITAAPGWIYQRPKGRRGRHRTADVKGPPGVNWSGSGFFINADGYFITNHHVAAGDAKAEKAPDGISYRVRLDDGTELPAELVGMDDKADIAIMRIKTDKPTAFLPIAKDDPEQGAEAMVLGFPATGSSEMSLQISKGTVKSLHPNEPYHVWFDLNTTHGNSGGPIVDKDGHVIGILTAAARSTT